MAPTTHPIRQPVDDVAAAVASFDGITYPKGASVLKQLFAFVGEDACVAGLRGYFAKYAWGNTRLADLMAELELASGRDLTGWTKGWLDTAGTDRLWLETTDAGATALRATGPNGTPRPHHLNVGVYDRQGDGGSLARRQLIALETTGGTTAVPDVTTAALLLVNDDDLTFASVRPDSSSLEAMLASAAQLPAAVSRAVAVTTAWDMLVWGDLAAADFVRCVAEVVRAEPVDSLVEPYLALAVEAASAWSADSRRDDLLEQVADVCLDLSANPAEVEQLGRADPDPDSWVRALAVDSARPDPAKKEATWRAIVDEHKVPMGALGHIRRAFWCRSQGELLAPYAQRYLEILPTLHLAGMIPALSVSNALYPRAGVDAAFAARAVAAAGGAGVSPAVAKTVVELTDRLNRMLKTRSL